MISIELVGGLGTQLFMIFATVSYAIDYGITYKIKSHIDKTLSDTPTYWDTFLDCFKKDVDDSISVQCKEVYCEPSFEYNSIPERLSHKDSIIKGYFQSYRYFEHNYDKIVEMMGLRKKQQDVREEYSNILSGKTIAIHFRFGDYVKLQEYHCVKPPSYFIDAIKSLSDDLNNRGENIENYKILYFFQQGSDKYMCEFLKIFKCVIKSKLNFVRVPDSIPDWKQMLLISCCDHIIITNSTFSWFGAYLSESPNKIVYRPKEWFGPANSKKNTKDLCPAEWKVISI